MDQQNNKEERVSAFTKPLASLPLVSTAPIGVSTNVATTKPYQEYFQRFVVLDPDARTLPNGDGVIRISPFDDYVIFTIYDLFQLIQQIRKKQILMKRPPLLIQLKSQLILVT